MKKISIILTFILATLSSRSFGWGQEGHQIVAEVAQNYLSPAVAEKVSAMLNKQKLADVANWADSIKSNPAWNFARTWHYVDIDDGLKYGDAPVNPLGDVVEAIDRLDKELMDTSLPKEKRVETLKFLVHFVGDIHQPLHVGRSSDKGGNLTNVTWDGKSKSLHSVWDSGLIDMKNKTYQEYASDLVKTYGKNYKDYEQRDVLTWVDEDLLLRNLVYNIDTNKSVNTYNRYFYSSNEIKPFRTFPQIYAARVMNTLDLQLFKAGVRLANLLNKSL